MDNSNSIIEKIKQEFPKFYITEAIDNDLKFKPEKDDGYVEYKRTLMGCTDMKAMKYATQMRWRMAENIKNLQANYYIGVDDDGSIIGLNNEEMYESIKKFISIAESIEASITGIRVISVSGKNIVWIGVKNKKLKDNFLVDFVEEI